MGFCLIVNLSADTNGPHPFDTREVDSRKFVDAYAVTNHAKTALFEATRTSYQLALTLKRTENEKLITFLQQNILS